MYHDAGYARCMASLSFSFLSIHFALSDVSTSLDLDNHEMFYVLYTVAARGMPVQQEEPNSKYIYIYMLYIFFLDV